MTAGERLIQTYLEDRGLKAFKNGAPDFFAYEPGSGEGTFVEVKSGSDKLRADQAAYHFALKECGIAVCVLRSHAESGQVWAQEDDQYAYLQGLFYAA